jgi:hypothetical protein
MKIFNVFPTRLRNLSCISPRILPSKRTFPNATIQDANTVKRAIFTSKVSLFALKGFFYLTFNEFQLFSSEHTLKVV